MRLLLINYEYPPIGGGAGNATWHLARELNAIGHRVTVLTAAFGDLKGWRDEAGVRVFRCSAARKSKGTSTLFEMLAFSVSATLALPRVVRHAKTDAAIVFFLFPCGPIGLIAHLLFRVPYLVSLRGGDVPGNDSRLLRIHRLLAPVRKLMYRTGVGIVANSNGLRKTAWRSDRVAIHMIPNGIDTNCYQPSGIGLKEGRTAFELLYAGRFQPEKNLSYLLQRLSGMNRNGAGRFVLHMVGEGPQEEELRQLSHKLGLEERIVWHGWLDRSDLSRLYQRVDCLVMPSRYEGMSNVILEAMACGLPVLASRVEGNIELVQDGWNGYLFDLNVPHAFEEAARQMTSNLSHARQMGNNARRFAVEHFSWKQAAEQYVAILERTSSIGR